MVEPAVRVAVGPRCQMTKTVSGTGSEDPGLSVVADGCLVVSFAGRRFGQAPGAGRGAVQLPLLPRLLWAICLTNPPPFFA